MVVAYVIGVLVVGLVVVGGIAYAYLTYMAEREERKRLEMEHDHVIRMIREEQDYEALMEFAEADAHDRPTTDRLDTSLDNDTDDHD